MEFCKTCRIPLFSSLICWTGEIFGEIRIKYLVATSRLHPSCTIIISSSSSSIGVGGSHQHSFAIHQFLTIWILERVLTVGVPGQFCHSKIFMALNREL